MTRAIAFLLFIGLSGTTWAAEIGGGYAACFSEAWHDEMMDAAMKKDKTQWEWLFSTKKCFTPKAGLPASVLGGFGVLKVRIYAGGNSAVIWTVRENVRR